jgi:hypothetical protein
VEQTSGKFFRQQSSTSALTDFIGWGFSASENIEDVVGTGELK